MKKFALCYSLNDKFYGAVIDISGKLEYEGRTLGMLRLENVSDLKSGSCYIIDIYEQELKPSKPIMARVVQKVLMIEALDQIYDNSVNEKVNKKIEQNSEYYEKKFNERFEIAQEDIRNQVMKDTQNERAGLEESKLKLQKMDKELTNLKNQASVKKEQYEELLLDLKKDKEETSKKREEINFEREQLKIEKESYLIRQSKDIAVIERAKEIGIIKKLNDANYSVDTSEESERMSNLPKDYFRSLHAYIEANGHHMEDEMFYALCISILTASENGQFILLTGPTGVGKSSAVRSLASAMNINNTVIAVRPAWLQVSDLIGRYNYKDNKFTPTNFLMAFISAKKNMFYTKMNFITLDEMNLSKFDHYGADIINGFERAFSDKPNEGFIDLHTETHKCDESSPFIYPELADGRVYIPNNIIVFGTLNIDDVGGMVSKKVIDRSIVIRFPSVIANETLYKRKYNNIEQPLWYFERNCLSKFRKDNVVDNVIFTQIWNMINSWSHNLQVLDVSLGYRAKKTLENMITAAHLIASCEEIDLRNNTELLKHLVNTFCKCKILPWINFLATDSFKSQALVSWLNDLERISSDPNYQFNIGGTEVSGEEILDSTIFEVRRLINQLDRHGRAFYMGSI